MTPTTKTIVGVGIAGALVAGGLTLGDKEKEVVIVPTKEKTYFAEMAEDGTVIQVIVADEEFINSGLVGDPNNWKQTYPEKTKRANFASRGDKYDLVKDVFIRGKQKEGSIYSSSTATWIDKEPKPIIRDETPTTTPRI